MTDTSDYARSTGTATNPSSAWDQLRHVSWGAIILGLVIAIAVQILLGLLGLGLGFMVLDPSDPMGGIAAWGFTSSIYLVITQIISLFVGGYIAARLASAHTGQTATFHGLSIWALATIAMVWLGGSAIGGAVSGVSSAFSGIATATAQAVYVAIPDEIDLPDLDFEALPEPVKETLEENDITPEELQQEVQAAYRDVVSEEQQQALVAELQQAVRAILQNPTDAPQEIDQAMDEIFGEEGILSQQELTELENTLQQRLNISDQEMEQITSQVQQATEQARQSVREAVQTAEQEAVEAAEAVSDQIGEIALWLFLANLLGLIAAIAGGKTGEIKTV